MFDVLYFTEDINANLDSFRSEGADGAWSTFDLRLGVPDQYVRVLVSTASPEVLVPLSELACSAPYYNNSQVPPDCAVSRGGLYNPNSSSTWVDGGTYGINQNGVGLGANLGYYQEAQFGLDKLGIGLSGPVLANQTVAGIATHSPFYQGILGLNNQPVNFSTLGNYSAPSLITTLKEQKIIPSISWSYTAGAKYRQCPSQAPLSCPNLVLAADMQVQDSSKSVASSSSPATTPRASQRTPRLSPWPTMSLEI